MTDVAGSTRLWESRADSMRQAIQRHDGIVSQAVETNGGQLIKERGEGDSHFCVFTTTDDAIRAAIAIQQRLPQEQWETGAPLVVRMSIHCANVEPHGGDYYGRDVNRCARIRAAGHGGQILISDTARDQVQGFDFLDLGLHRLNDLSEQQRIYQVLEQDIPREFPPIKSLNAVKHNLPVQLTSFIGREKELEELRKLAMGPRLISILGPGGAGKTRTALQLAAESVEQVKGGVWFVDLSPIQDPASLTQKVIEDLYVRVGADEPDDAIAAHFQGEKTLLVLDNCEHVAREAAAFTEKLLKKAPSLYIIATSREPLGVSGERTYRLPPMNVQADKTETLEDIEHLDSVSLLLDRAKAKGYEEVLEQTKPQTILDLCKKLDGIPLALEQAAANLAVLSVESMLARLDEQLSILSMDDEGVQARHRTLSAAIDWSYEALSDQERNLFLDLAVFSGGWTLEAAESICEQPKVLDVMQRLVNKSLVTPGATEKGERRFRLLETMREYALEKRPLIPDQIRHRHLAYYSHLAKVAAEAGLDVDGGKWAKALDNDHSNIIAALNNALRETGDGVEALDLANVMAMYWLRRDFYRQGSLWIQSALDAAEDAPVELRANALNRLGVFSIYQRKLAPAKVAIEASLELWTELGEKSKMGAALNNLAWIALEQEDKARARELFERAVELFAKMGNDPHQADALQNLAQMDWDEGEQERAIERTQSALALRRRAGDKQLILAPLTNLLGFYAETSGLKSHLESVEEAVEVAKEVGNANLIASTLDIVAFVANESGNARPAARFIGAANEIIDSIGIDLAHQSKLFRNRLEAKVKASLERRAFKKEIEAGAKLDAYRALAEAETFLDSI